MNIRETALPPILVIEPAVFADHRGYFLETFQAERYRGAGITFPFVQDNLSLSRRGVLRGLHLQNPHPQDKLVFAAHGSIFDVAVDVRSGSPTFSRWVGEWLSAENARQLFIPKGFAHAFCVVSETAVVAYKCSTLYAPEAEMTLIWNDPDIGICWPIDTPIVSNKDAAGMRLRDIPLDRLPALCET
jgi:dTDP-4-dehydrorhamnose 3,5-epimerase